MGKRGISAEEVDENLARILKELTIEQGKTLRSLVEATGISLGRLSDLFNGIKPFYVNDLVNLAEALGVPASTVFRRAEEAIAAEQSTNLVPFPTQSEPEFTPEIAQRSAAKTPHHPLDGHTTEHGLNYDDLGEENQDPENWAE